MQIDPKYKPCYLGDGLYAWFDGYQLALCTERDEGRVHEVFLEPSTYRALQAYALTVFVGLEKKP